MLSIQQHTVDSNCIIEVIYANLTGNSFVLKTHFITKLYYFTRVPYLSLYKLSFSLHAFHGPNFCLLKALQSVFFCLSCNLNTRLLITPVICKLVVTPSVRIYNAKAASAHVHVHVVWIHGGILIRSSCTTCPCLSVPIPTMTLTHWGRLRHIYVSKLTIIGSDKGLSPGRRQAFILTSAGVFLTDRAINAEFFVVGPNLLLNKQYRSQHGPLCMYLRGVGDWRCLEHIAAGTNQPPCRRRHFQMHFLEWKYLNLDTILVKSLTSLGLNKLTWQWLPVHEYTV